MDSQREFVFGWVGGRYEGGITFLREMRDYLPHLFQFGYTFDLMGSDRIYLKLFSFWAIGRALFVVYMTSKTQAETAEKHTYTSFL